MDLFAERRVKERDLDPSWIRVAIPFGKSITWACEEAAFIASGMDTSWVYTWIKGQVIFAFSDARTAQRFHEFQTGEP